MTNAIQLVSSTSTGSPTMLDNLGGAMSANGRYVVFTTESDNLVTGDTNNSSDVYLKDMQTGAVSRISTPTQSIPNLLRGSVDEPNAYWDVHQSISADGRYVAFTAQTLTGPGVSVFGVFLKDTQTGALSQISIPQTATYGNAKDVSMSPDGRFLVFWTQTSGLWPVVFEVDLQAGTSKPVSTTSMGSLVTGSLAQVSDDGRYVLFSSSESNLVIGDTNKNIDTFRKDMVTGEVIRVSTDVSGVEINGITWFGDMSGDGQYVSYFDDHHVYYKNILTGVTQIASSSANGTVGNGEATGTQISQDGRFVVFTSSADNLVSNDTNGHKDVFVKDMATGQIARLSENASGTQGNGESSAAAISADGHYISFTSKATNLVTSDINGRNDVFRVENPFYVPTGSSGSDSFSDTAGNQTLDGKGGIDTFSYAGSHASHTISQTSTGYTVSDNVGSGGTDALSNIERLHFSDKNVALDIAGNAVKTLEFIGVIAPSLQSDLAIRGAILGFFDQGYSMEQLCQLALDVGLAPTDNTALANAVYHNVLGGTASQSETNMLVSYIEQLGDAKFLATVAGLNLNVDLVGLQQHGMEYL